MNDEPVVYVVDDDVQSRRAVTTLVEAMGLAAVGHDSAEEFLVAYDGRPLCPCDVSRKAASHSRRRPSGVLIQRRYIPCHHGSKRWGASRCE